MVVWEHPTAHHSGIVKVPRPPAITLLGRWLFYAMPASMYMATQQDHRGYSLAS